jgi:hypothetical protein
MATQVLVGSIVGVAINREANGVESLTITIKVNDATAATLDTGAAADLLRPVDGGIPRSWSGVVGTSIDVSYSDVDGSFVTIAETA